MAGSGEIPQRQIGDELVPYLGKRRLGTSQDRMKFLAERYGDRFVDTEISEFLSLTSASQRETRLRGADLVVGGFVEQLEVGCGQGFLDLVRRDHVVGRLTFYVKRVAGRVDRSYVRF